MRKDVPSRDDSRLFMVVRRHLLVTKSLSSSVRRLQKIASWLLFCTLLGVFLGFKKPLKRKTHSLSTNYDNPLRFEYLRPNQTLMDFARNLRALLSKFFRVT